MLKPALQLPDGIQETVKLALAEDLGNGDITTALIAANKPARARIISRQHAILCGRPWFDEVFTQLNQHINVEWYVQDSDSIAPEQTICTLEGNARLLLSGERTALNFLHTLSATATITKRYVDAIAGTGCTILDTRKTLPGLRTAQKYAVRCGGGTNHRHGLFDAFLIKENHIAATGSITSAIQAARQQNSNVLLEVEVENLEQLQEAIEAQPDRVLLDNFFIEDLKKAVTITNNRVELEASGNITLKNIRAYAKTGINFISIGSLTKNIEAVDLSMRFI